ncbi:TolC family protein [Candidatus Latescibacterota bacterium]
MVSLPYSVILIYIFIQVWQPSSANAQPRVMQSLRLEDTIAIALENNRDIQNAVEEVSKADYRVLEAASGAMPQINGFWDSQKTLKQQVFVISFPDSEGVIRKSRLKVGTDYNMSLGATLTQPLYVGGKVGTALEAAGIYREMSNETLETVQQNVVMGVVTAFNGVLLARQVNRISVESLEQAERHLENVENLFDAGLATEYDLLRARVNVANLRPNVIDSENNIKISLLKLKEIMGADPTMDIDISGELTEPDTTLFAQASPEVAFDNRPDVLVSQKNVDLYEKNIKITRGDFLPIITAGTTFMYSGNFDEFKYDAADWTPFWYASVSLSFPIFSGLNNYSRYKQAKIDHQKARTDYRKMLDATEIEVNEAVMNLSRAVNTIQSQKLNVQEAQRAVELAGLRYTNGKATQLEVLDAQLALEVARNNMATALFDGQNAEIALKKSLGLIIIEH